MDILVLEDDVADAELVKRELRKAGLDFTAHWVQDKAGFVAALETTTPDLILADYSLPGFDGLTALTLARQRWVDVPVIIVSGAIGEELAIDTLKAGATDYVLKQRLSRLGPVVHRALAEARERAEKRRAEEALREANATLESKVAQRTAELEKERQRLYDVLETLPVMICLLTPDYRIAFANRSFRQTFGESHGRHCYESCFGRAQPCEFCESYQVLKTGRPHHWEATSPDGGTIIDAYDFPFTDTDGSSLILEMDIDITERKRAEAALQELNETLEHRARQLQKLALEVSEAEDRERRRLAEILHDDLQQVLAAARFHLTLLENRAAHQPALEAIVSQVEQLLLEAIRKSRSLSHELSPVVLHQGDLGEALHWLAEQVRTKHGLRVTVETFGQVNTQSEALKMFLYKAAQELLFNVVKHARTDAARIRVRRRGRYLCLSVSDHGRGFDPRQLRETAGFGLLSIRERIELLGGRMKIRSAADEGSTFHIVVPDGPGERRKVRGAEGEKVGGALVLSDGLTLSPSPSPGGPRLRVLLADDHRIVREGLASLLSEQNDIEVVGEAANGREAINLAYRLQPDIVVMDVAMPLIDGDEATRQIKAHLPKTRIIALSMHNEPTKRETMYRSGAESYVLKSAPSAELLGAIRGTPLSSQPESLE